MNQTEQLIEVGRAYIDALNKLDENYPESVSRILDILNCVHPDPDYQFGIYIEEPSPNEAPSHMCDQAWFHCYQGKEKSIMKHPYKPSNGGYYHLGNMCYLRFTFDFFNHLSIEPTAMGAWQAYLLSIAKTLLPFSGGLYYTKREMIFTNEQVKDIRLSFKKERTIELMNLKVDVSPSIKIDGKHAIVSCCHWNDWDGLTREHANIIFFNDRVYLFDDFENEKLFKYNCGICF